MRRRIVTKSQDGPKGPESSQQVLGANGPTGPTPEQVINSLAEQSMEAFQNARTIASQAAQNSSQTIPRSGESTPPELIRGVDRIVKSIFDDRDLGDEYEELRKGLQFTDRASSKTIGQIQDALDQATENAQRISELVAGARVVGERYMADRAIILSGIRERAQHELIQAKKAGNYQGRSSAEDVEAMMAQLAPDQYRDLASQEAQIKHTIKVLEALESNWTERTRNLRAMLSAMQR